MALFRQCSMILRHSALQTISRAPIQARSIKRWVAPTLRELEKRRRKQGPQAPQPRSTYLEWNYDAEIFAFAKRLGENFDDALLRRAFTHRTFIIQQELAAGENAIEISSEDNREMIKEGEAFISQHIKRKYEAVYLPDIVNSIHDYLTAESMLAHVASHLGAGDLIRSVDFPVEKKTLSNTFKAVVAALRHSVDDKQAGTFLDDFLITQLNGKDIYDLWELKNPYEYLLRLLKEKGAPEIEPRLCNQSAVNTILANYQVGLYSDKKLLGIGWGESVEVAKDTAALDAIQNLHKIVA